MRLAWSKLACAFSFRAVSNAPNFLTQKLCFLCLLLATSYLISIADFCHFVIHNCQFQLIITFNNRSLTPTQLQQVLDYIILTEIYHHHVESLISAPLTLPVCSKSCYGISPHQYVIQHAVERAKLIKPIWRSRTLLTSGFSQKPFVATV